jgi:Niemann-Pick C1 protein
MASVAEACMFFLGITVGLPAVNSFCICAGVAVVINYILQMTFFVSLMSLDARRTDVSELLAIE